MAEKDRAGVQAARAGYERALLIGSRMHEKTSLADCIEPHQLNGHPRPCAEDPALHEGETLDRSDAGRRGAKVDPMRAGAVDQVDLPGADVVLDRLLALDGLPHVGELLVPDERMDAIFSGERSRFSGAVLFDASGQPVGDADVERTVWFAGKKF